MNIKVAKAYCTTSNDAFCILTGIAPAELKTEEAANIYRITKDRQNQLLDHETDHQDWTHLADTVRITEQNETMEHTIHTRVGTLIVATIYLQLVQNRYMF